MSKLINGVTQTEAIKIEILNALEKGKGLDKYQIYTIVETKLQVPRATVRKVTRLVIEDLQRKLSVLQQSKVN